MDYRHTLTGRLADGLRRRLRYAWSRVRYGHREPPVEAALGWLLAHGPQNDRPPNEGLGPSPRWVGLGLETLHCLGCREPARRWAAWLVTLQQADGSLPGPNRPEGSLSDTASALRGWLALLDDLPELETPARRAAEWLLAQRGQCLDSFPPSSQDLLALFDAGHRWPESGFLPIAEELLEASPWGEEARNRPSDEQWLLLDRAEIYARLGKLPAARGLVEALARRQLRQGQAATSLALTRFAAIGYQVGLREPADQALRLLERRQDSSGRFSGNDAVTPSSRRRLADPLTVEYYLDAARLRVLAAFETVGQELPAEIDPADGRVQAAAEWMRRLPASARVADVGCGKGRFLEHLAAWFPQAELVGVDISKAMLAQLPPGVRALEGSLLRIPLVDAALDGALAVESLEHALLPQEAVAELCRVVRPGGSVLVIDKNRARQPLSYCDPWERWFTPQELATWLGRWCEEVTVSPVAHLEGRPGRNLFLAASGRRKG
jgi:malonyl-CoA O-methyltransferase